MAKGLIIGVLLLSGCMHTEGLEEMRVGNMLFSIDMEFDTGNQKTKMTLGDQVVDPITHDPFMGFDKK